MFVPVVDKNQNPLMPTTPARAAKWIKSGKATSFWKNGIFCVRLNVEPSKRWIQDIAIGVDPGSKKEGFTVKSASHTYLNIQADAHTHTQKKIKNRRELRRGRRSRKCPNRKNRTNRLANRKCIPPSTRARWHWKVRILDWLSKVYPITHICVEDIKARTWKGAKKWNQSFSPLEVGKQWFYSEIRKRWKLSTLQGHETKGIRDRLELRKSSQKVSETFDAHCVDSWCLAYHTIGGNSIIDNTDIFCISPINIQRRCLHRQLPQKGNKRPRYGGTMCLGVVKNTIVKSAKHGLAVICGHNNGYLNLQSIEGGRRISRSTKLSDCKILTKLNFRYKSISKQRKVKQE